MKTFDDFDEYDEKEDFFLELAHIDELQIRFDFIKYKIYMFYCYENNRSLFHKIKKRKIFYIDDFYMFSKFEKKFHTNYKNTRIFMKKMIDKYFNLYDYTPDSSDEYFII
jgi:hypothetical protein